MANKKLEPECTRSEKQNQPMLEGISRIGQLTWLVPLTPGESILGNLGATVTEQ
jgi:hypothetical protein